MMEWGTISIKLNAQAYPPLPLDIKTNSDVNPRTHGNAPVLQGDSLITKSGPGVVLANVSQPDAEINISNTSVQTPFAVVYPPGAASGDVSEVPFIYVTISEVPAKYVGQSCRIQLCAMDYGENSGHYVLNSSSTLVQQQTTFNICLESGYNVPFGLRGYWMMYFFPSDSSNLSCNDPEAVLLMDFFPMEMYILMSPLPGYWQQSSSQQSKAISKLPLLLLRMFLLPVMHLGMELTGGGPASFIELVTNICIGFQKPMTGDQATVPNAETTAQKGVQTSADAHWLKYEVWDGHPSFVGMSGGGFALDNWLLAYRSFLAFGAFTTINCYDQAGITDIVLSLCFDPASVVWTFKQPFGFIPATDWLVGWGYCNNPYFVGDMSKIVLDPLDPARYPFRNHAYVTVKSSGSNVVVDACAGPFRGVPQLEYEQSVDSNCDSTRLSKFSKLTLDAPSITGVNGRSQYQYEKNYFANLKSMWQDWYGDASKSLADITTYLNQNSISGICYVDVATLTSWFDQKVQTVLWDVKDAVQTQPVAPIQGSNCIQLEHKMWNDTSIPDSYAYFRLYFTSDRSTAIQTIETRLSQSTMPANAQVHVSSNTNAATLDPKVAAVQDTLTAGQVNIQVLGSKHMEIFVYKNLVVEIGNLEKNDTKVAALVAQMWQEIYSIDQAYTPALTPEQWSLPALTYIGPSSAA